MAATLQSIYQAPLFSEESEKCKGGKYPQHDISPVINMSLARNAPVSGKIKTKKSFILLCNRAQTTKIVKAYRIGARSKRSRVVMRFFGALRIFGYLTKSSDSSGMY